MIGIATAIIGGAAISGVLGSAASNSAAKASARGAASAAEATIESTRMQVEEIGRQFDYQMKILQPQIQLQFNAQRAYHDLLGIGGPELGDTPPGVDFEADATAQRNQEISDLTGQLNTLREKQSQPSTPPASAMWGRVRRKNPRMDFPARIQRSMHRSPKSKTSSRRQNPVLSRTGYSK